ncbi:MAG TPA: GTP-binding protein, partial [Telluria sp.]
RINPRAKITHSDFGHAPLAEVLDLRGFNLNDKLEIDPAFLTADEAMEQHHHHGHDDGEHEHVHTESCDHSNDHHSSHHSDDIAAFVFKSERAFDPARLDQFLGSLVQVFGPRMLRYKGVLLMEGADRKVVFQGVHQIMGSDLGAKWGEAEDRGSKMVFIGKNLPKDVFIRGLEQCLV